MNLRAKLFNAENNMVKNDFRKNKRFCYVYRFFFIENFQMSWQQ